MCAHAVDDELLQPWGYHCDRPHCPDDQDHPDQVSHDCPDGCQVCFLAMVVFFLTTGATSSPGGISRMSKLGAFTHANRIVPTLPLGDSRGEGQTTDKDSTVGGIDASLPVAGKFTLTVDCRAIFCHCSQLALIVSIAAFTVASSCTVEA